MRTMNVLKLAQHPQNKDLTIALYTIMNFELGENLIEEVNICKYSDLDKLAKEKNVNFKNFRLNIAKKAFEFDSMSVVVTEFSTIQELFKQLHDIKDNPKKTVISIIRELARLNSKAVFKEEFYSQQSGGSSFQDFIPSFEDTYIKMDDLIIARKKMNIVLVTTIKGQVQYSEEEFENVSRYYPFKIMKAGRVLYDGLDIVIDDINREYLLTELSLEDKGGYVTLNLKEYPVYDDRLNFIKGSEILGLIIESTNYKAVLNSKKHVYNLIRETMKSSGLLGETTEWFHGEKVEEDYVSDQGYEYIDIWRKGHKTFKSIETRIYEELDGADDFINLVEALSIHADEPNINVAEIVNAMEELVEQGIKKNALSEVTVIACKTLIECIKDTRDINSRYLTIRQSIKESSLGLRNLELHLLQIRTLFQDNILNPMTLGRTTLGKKTEGVTESFEIYLGYEAINYKRGIINKKYDYFAQISSKAGDIDEEDRT